MKKLWLLILFIFNACESMDTKLTDAKSHDSCKHNVGLCLLDTLIWPITLPAVRFNCWQDTIIIWSGTGLTWESGQVYDSGLVYDISGATMGLQEVKYDTLPHDTTYF